MQQSFSYLFLKKSKMFFLIFGLMIALISSLAAMFFRELGLVFICLFGVLLVHFIFIFRNPKIGLITLIVYCFTFGLLGREIGGLPFGIGIDFLLVFILLASLLHYKKNDFLNAQNDLALLYFIWFLMCVAQVLNPSGASLFGWLQELRSSALYPVLMVPLTLIIFNDKKDLDLFIYLILALALIAALNGIRQSHFGLTAAETAFVNSPAGATHLIFGKLRAFSFYDAGQFGAFESVFVVIAVVLALGSSKIWKKIVLILFAIIYGYAMLVSGTRGAFFALILAAISAITLTKNFKALIFGGLFMLFFVGMLKFTSIGAGNYQISRFRSSMDPDDPSLNVRFNTQRMLRDYLSAKPFGGGLGTLGAFSVYNEGHFLANVQPDSYWVKIWAMTGIVGLTIWFSILMYILGKCCGIIWKIQDKKLKVKLIAIFSASVGIFFCSYGNEVINNMPSSLIVCMSFAFVYLGPKFEHQIMKESLLKNI